MNLIFSAILKAIEANPEKVLDILSKLLDLFKEHPELTKTVLTAVVTKANEGTNA